MVITEPSYSHKVNTLATIRDRSHVNMASGCLVFHHILHLHWLVSYDGSRLNTVIKYCISFNSHLEKLLLHTVSTYIKCFHNVYSSICASFLTLYLLHVLVQFLVEIFLFERNTKTYFCF